ncbi:hypothetical protein GGR56DRAFT_575928 [Xylariaceae sp. FL0804]|nr:hypothetical protein GGR56DRAFT_575928 [Xylariaceae sp. FL0804]
MPCARLAISGLVYELLGHGTTAAQSVNIAPGVTSLRQDRALAAIPPKFAASRSSTLAPRRRPISTTESAAGHDEPGGPAGTDTLAGHRHQVRDTIFHLESKYPKLIAKYFFREASGSGA